MNSSGPSLEFEPVTSENWPDMQKLFGERGAYGGCWCMYWRLAGNTFSSLSGAERKGKMAGLIGSGVVPGILAYRDGVPIGWCSLAPREGFQRLERSKVFRRVDDQRVWSVVCFYVEKSSRRRGVMEELLKAGVKYAASRGATIVEGYPIDPSEKNYPDPYAYTGLARAFRNAGFVEVERRSEKRPIMRLYINGNKP